MKETTRPPGRNARRVLLITGPLIVLFGMALTVPAIIQAKRLF